MKKTIKKNTFKPVYTVDITKCESVDDILVAFAEAKQKAGVALRDEELEALINSRSIAVIIENTPICICEKPKKINIFKRFWNWLTRKNK